MARRIGTVVDVLRNGLYEEPFGGAERGKFKMSRNDTKKLLDVCNLHPVRTANLAEEAIGVNLAVIEVGDEFYFIDTEIMKRWRKVDDDVLDKFLDEMTQGDDEE